jgi:serine/threonine protein kinase
LPVLTQLGPYLIDEELAEGGMARVFRARLRGLGGFEKTLVIKQIKPELAKDPRFVELFVREANTLVSLSHPHIVPVYELGAAEGTYYLSMEYVDGATVARILEDGSLAPELVAHLGAQVCDALDYAHGRFGILHRDITPRNIIVDQAGHARLLDFGIAGALGVVDNDVFGSPGYMAPEQARRKALTPASDVFSLGAVLFEALTGRAAFEKTARGSLVPAPELGAVPEQLARVIRPMLAQEPTARPQSAADVARQLRGYLAQARPEGVLAEMRERAQAARPVRPSPAPDPLTGPVTAQIEAQPIATSAVLTEILRSAPGVAMSSALASVPAAAEATRRIEDSADDTSAATTASMLRAWPWLALATLAAAMWLGITRTPQRDITTQQATSQASRPDSPPTPPQPTPVEPVQPEPANARADAGARTTVVEKPPAAGNATLSVSATPWAEVSIDGRSQGSTPLRALKVRAGSHVIKLRCPPLGKESELRVQIAADARARLSVDLTADPPRTFLDGLSKVR